MSLSKRLRYEILRRDDFTCRYCHATDVPLTVDHVVPIALGGKDEPTNLVTACKACNTGKSSTNPDAPLVENVSDDAIRWAKAVQTAAKIQSKDVKARQNYVAKFDAYWSEWICEADRQWVFRPEDWENSIGRFHDLGLPLDVLIDAAGVALRNRRISQFDAWRYFCGCCWRKLEDLKDAAEQIVRETV